MKCPNWLWRWVDGRGCIPVWVCWLWPHSHFCPEMDDLLIIDNLHGCYCGRVARKDST